MSFAILSGHGRYTSDQKLDRGDVQQLGQRDAAGRDLDWRKAEGGIPLPERIGRYGSMWYVFILV